MIKFKDFLVEILQGKNILPWKITDELPSTFAAARFDSFIVIIEKFNERYTDFSSYRVSFADESMPSFSKQIMPTGIRTTKDTIRIYNTIGNIIKTKLLPHLKSNDIIYFESASAKTFGIYQVVAKKLAKEINGSYKRIGTATFKVTKK